MLERVRNLIKCDRKKSRSKEDDAEVTPKRSKQKMDTIIRRYPVTISRNSDSVPDQETMSQHMQALSQEMGKKQTKRTNCNSINEGDFFDSMAVRD